MKSLAKVERQLEPQARSQARSRPSLRSQEQEAGPTPASRPMGAPSDQSGHSFNQISVLPRPALHIQRKLAIGPSSDGYELEADRVAEQVMRMPEPRSAALGLSSSVAAL